MTGSATTFETASGAATQLRRLRRNLRRERRRLVSWEDRIYPYYLALFVFAYVGIFAAGVGDIRIGERRIAETAPGQEAVRSLSVLLSLLILGLVVGKCAAARDGGPLSIPLEDLRVLLPAPVPRRPLLRAALLRALTRGVAGALGASGVLLLADVALLSRTLMAALPSVAFFFVALVALTSFGCLSQVNASASVVGRWAAPVGTLILLACGWHVALVLGDHGQVAAWHSVGQLPGAGLVEGLEPGASPTRWVPLLAGAAAICVTSMLATWQSVDHVTPEEISDRSTKTRAVRNALLLGQTSSVYVLRRASTRRRRVHRWLPSRPAMLRRSLLGKALLQEQGAPMVPRVLLATVTTIVIVAALTSTPHVTTIPPLLVSGAAGGIFLAGVATRYVDPLRIDTELYGPAPYLPRSRRLVAAADIAAPTITFGAGSLLGAVLIPAMHLQEWSSIPSLFVFALALALLSTAVGAVSAAASSDPIQPSDGSLVLRRSVGPILATACLTITALVMHSPTTVQHGVHIGLGMVTLAVLACLAFAMAATRGGSAVAYNS